MRVIEATQVTVLENAVKKSEDQIVRCIDTCDGPNCQKPDAVCKGTLTWFQTTPEEIPDTCFRFLTLLLADGTTKTFFSAECLRDYMRTYVPLQSPREKAAVMMSLDQWNAKHPHLVQKTDNPPPPTGGSPAGGVTLPIVKTEAIGKVA